MTILESILNVMQTPMPANIRELRGDLLQHGVPYESPVWETLEYFHEFLNQLCAGMSAHEYSKLATLLDIGAVGGVALENILQSDLALGDLWKRLLVGAASEALMVVASRQYVKAFLAETSAVYAIAAWNIHRLLWQLSLRTQHDLPPVERRQMIDQILAPIYREEVSGQMKAILIGRLFLVVLLLNLNESLQLSDLDGSSVTGMSTEG